MRHEDAWTYPVRHEDARTHRWLRRRQQEMLRLVESYTAQQEWGRVRDALALLEAIETVLAHIAARAETS